MNKITLKGDGRTSYTLISNIFLDQYMPEANGEFVKIYLRLLRLSSNGCSDLTLTGLADFFGCTENDIIRALRYWDKANLLTLEFDAKQELTGLSINNPEEPKKAEAIFSEKQVQKPSVSTEERMDASALFTPDKVRELRQQEDIKQLIFIAEQYMEKTLTPTEITQIIYFHEGLHMSADLIEYLIEYCVSKGSKSIRYMEKVALSWTENKIQTVEEAKANSSAHNKKYYSVLKALGITGRNPVSSEIAFIDHWNNDLGFDQTIIAEACSRTIQKLGNPSFKYVDGILSNWHKSGVHHISDIQKLDADYLKEKNSEKKASEKNKKAKGNQNRFNNFHQRNYDYSNLEKQLLSK